MKLRLFFFVLLSTAHVFAQESSSSGFGLSSVKLGVSSNSTNAILKGASGPDTEYRTTPASGFGLGFNLGPLILMLDTSGSTDSDVTKYGETKTSQARLRFHGLNHSFDVNSTSRTGLYIENSKEVAPTTPADTYVKRPDMKMDTFRFDYTYTLTPEDFHAGILDQSIVPRQSGGSWMIGGNAENMSLSGNPTIADAGQVAAYGDVGTLQKVSLTSVRAAVGGGYVFEYSGWYAAFAGMLSAGPQWQQLDDSVAGGNETKTVIGSDVAAKLSLGFNADHFFTALNFEGTGSTQKVRSGSLTTSQSLVGLWFGWRF